MSTTRNRKPEKATPDGKVQRLPSSENIAEVLTSENLGDGRVTDEELLDVLALAQFTSGLVFTFICSLGILAIYAEQQETFSDRIPGSELIWYKFAESMVSTISGILVKFATDISTSCCGSTAMVPFIRGSSIILDVALLIAATAALFWPPKSYMSPITLGTIYIIEVTFYSSLLFFLVRLMVMGPSKPRELKDEDGHQSASSNKSSA